MSTPKSTHVRSDPLQGVRNLTERLADLGRALVGLPTGVERRRDQARQRQRRQARRMALCAVALVVLVSCLAFGAGRATAAVWRGHIVKGRMDGQIDATPCPSGDCLRGYVGVYRDGMNVGDHVVRCAWPRHPRVLQFDHGRHHNRIGWDVKVRTCGRHYWWRFK